MREFSASELEALDRLNLDGPNSPAKSSPLSKNTVIEPAQIGLERVAGSVKSTLVDIGLLERKAEETNGAGDGKEGMNGHA
jgi:hypothetical protein